MKVAEMQRLALDVRDEVGLDAHEVFDPHLFTNLYGIDVIQVSTLDCRPEVMDHFAATRSEVFSGALMPLTSGLAIIENDHHESVRRKSTLFHEIAHVVLEHKFSARVVSDQGCGATEPEQEKEAAKFSGELIIPFEAARKMAWRDLTDEAVAEFHKISVQMAGWRMNASGARKIVSRARRRRG